jgi:hypothetical protein
MHERLWPFHVERLARAKAGGLSVVEAERRAIQALEHWAKIRTQQPTRLAVIEAERGMARAALDLREARAAAKPSS